MPRFRLQAPSENGAILSDPNLDAVASLIERNRATLDAWHCDFHGRSSQQLRAMVRATVLAAAREYTGDGGAEGEQGSGGAGEQGRRGAGEQGSNTEAISNQQSAISNSATHHSPLTTHQIIATGHQPELFHPGVWIKNFASYALAQQHGGMSLHLIVDNDTVKRTTVRVPTGSPAEPSVVHIPLDRWRGEIPYEEYVVSDESLFAEFGQRVESALEPLAVEPLVREFWPMAIDAGRSTGRLSERMARARRRQEAAWGCHNLELPVSRLCQTEGFYWFACHLLAQLPRFHEVHNSALDDYRRRNRIRSRNHPVPTLARDGPWLEAPFWVWSEQSPRRRHLFVQPRGREILLADRDQWTHSLPLGPDREACCAVSVLGDLARHGIKIRTRALTTTIFTRLLLADLFIHGVGGARYDELTDEILRRFFGLEPPRFLTLTGTLHLPVAAGSATTKEFKLSDLHQLLRDLTYNPDRHLPSELAQSSDISSLVGAKRQAIHAQPATRAERRRRFEEIRRINDLLAPSVAKKRSALTQQLDSLRAAVAAGVILRSRDWAFCAYPAGSLRTFFAPFLPN